MISVSEAHGIGKSKPTYAKEVELIEMNEDANMATTLKPQHKPRKVVDAMLALRGRLAQMLHMIPTIASRKPRRA